MNKAVDDNDSDAILLFQARYTCQQAHEYRWQCHTQSRHRSHLRCVPSSMSGLEPIRSRIFCKFCFPPSPVVRTLPRAGQQINGTARRSISQWFTRYARRILSLILRSSYLSSSSQMPTELTTTQARASMNTCWSLFDIKSLALAQLRLPARLVYDGGGWRSIFCHGID